MWWLLRATFLVNHGAREFADTRIRDVGKRRRKQEPSKERQRISGVITVAWFSEKTIAVRGHTILRIAGEVGAIDDPDRKK